AEDQLRGEGDDRDGPAGGSLCANPPVPPQPHGAPPPADLQHPEGQEAAAAAGTRPWGCRRTGQTGGPRGGGFGSPVSCFPLPSPAVRGCAAPPVLKHQLYSLVRDRTAVDRQLSRLKDEGLIRLFQLGFDSDVFGVAFTQDYTAKVLQSVAGKEHAGTVRRFLETAFASCPELSYDNGRMLRDFGFRDPDITQLVNAGVLTVRDAGSWWLAVPGAGRFVKCFIKGRKAVLGMIQKAKYKEILLSDLQSRRAPSAVKLGLPYHIHDLIGAQLVDCIPSTSGTLLRLADS
uniref:Serine/threonine kinase 19 n=1 Tax=Chrysemys picta bellii TaxID=8478 RepID=A0A8C3F8F6_CHRPI